MRDARWNGRLPRWVGRGDGGDHVVLGEGWTDHPQVCDSYDRAATHVMFAYAACRQECVGNGFAWRPDRAFPFIKASRQQCCVRHGLSSATPPRKGEITHVLEEVLQSLMCNVYGTEV